jgi:hypothetical protein
MQNRYRTAKRELANLLRIGAVGLARDFDEMSASEYAWHDADIFSCSTKNSVV